MIILKKQLNKKLAQQLQETGGLSPGMKQKHFKFKEQKKICY